MAHFTGTTNPPTDIYPPPPPPPPQAVVANSVSTISPQFCGHTYPIDLAIVRKVLTITDGNFVVQDINGNILFKVKGTLLTVHDRRVLLDSARNPIVTLRRKIMTAHDRWQVFRGESTELSDLIFTAKRSSMFQLKTKLDMFLANNTKEDVCDFKINGSWLERSCVIYAGESSTVVAQMHKKHSTESILLGKDKFMVTVYPNIDYAFIVSLIVILDAINTESGGGSGGGFDILSGIELYFPLFFYLKSTMYFRLVPLLGFLGLDWSLLKFSKSTSDLFYGVLFIEFNC